MRSVYVLLVLIATAYLGVYGLMSRHAYAEADRQGMKGFYYQAPEDTDSWRMRNQTCELLFAPVNTLDQWLGLGRAPADEPMFGLSR